MMSKDYLKELEIFIMTEVDGEPSKNEGVVDTTIRIIRTLIEENKRLKNLDKKSGVFVPKKGEKHWFISPDGVIKKTTYKDVFSCDRYRQSIGFQFRTEEDAERRKRALITKRKLELLADRLNDGRVIDWDDYKQVKFYMYHRQSTLCQYYDDGLCKMGGVVYCLNGNFLGEAKEEIGTEALIEYIESGV